MDRYIVGPARAHVDPSVPAHFVRPRPPWRAPVFAVWLAAVFVAAASGEDGVVTVGGRTARALSFDTLASFNYPMPGEVTDVPAEIPAAIQALDQERVALTGFLLPFQGENGLTTQAVLLRSQLSCCYGVAPAFTEFVLVTAEGEGIRAVMDVPVTLVGTLKVGETYKDGYLVGIYHLAVESIMEDAR